MSQDFNSSLDLGNIVLFEHINLDVPDQIIASIFYCEGLCLTRDPFDRVSTPTMWVNVGSQQIHLPNGAGQKAGGNTFGLIFPDLKLLQSSLKKVESKLKGTQFSWKMKKIDSNVGSSSKDLMERKLVELYSGSDSEEFIEVTCPWGNIFRVHQQDNVPNESKFRSSLGIAYVELICPKGTSKAIGEHYEHFFNAKVNFKGENLSQVPHISVTLGPHQKLIYREADEGEDVPEYEGWHIAVYISNFSQTFKRLNERGLIFTSKLFRDQVDTLDEAVKAKQFRTKDFVLVNSKEKEVIYSLHHEVRSIYHSSYMRPLVNRYGNTGIYCNQ